MARDDAYLLDILIAARKACKFVEGLSPDDFQGSDLHQNAVIRALVQTVWDTVQDDLPSLIAVIEPLVPPDD
jgi:uncharacterized protein with HEPN domain